jgi:2-desacetyl-2-hydroxyethyl bacteriochlorophyllide A dehydrogenase
MRAMVFRRGGLNVEELAQPAPGPEQVLLRTRACGICGSDLHVARFAEDLMRAAPGQAFVTMDLDRGVVMGHEWVAEVVAAGAGAEQWTPGTRVVGRPVTPAPGVAPRPGPGYNSDFPGGYGEYMLVHASRLLGVPEHVPDLVAATTEPCAVGLHAARAASLGPEDRVLVMGAGPIGMMTLLWVKRSGVRHVTVSEVTAPRRELARTVGADAVVDPTAGELAGQNANAAGGPPTVVFECVGVEGTLQQAMELAAPGGQVVVAGVCMTEDRIQPRVAIGKQLTLRFVLAYTPDEVTETLEALAAGKVDTAPLVTRSIGLEELPAAFGALADPQDCKVMVVFQ